MEFPLEIGHIEEIEEHIVETEEAPAVVYSEIKRVPKPAPTNQKIVLIQTSEGLTRAVRVHSAAASASTSSTPVILAGSSSAGSTVQLIKTEDGYVQVAKPAPVQRVVAPANVVVRSGAPATKTFVVGGGQSKGTKTMSLAQAEQLGLITKVSAGSSTQSSKVLTLNPTIKQEPGVPAKASGAPAGQRVIKVASARGTGQKVALKTMLVTGDSPRVAQGSARGATAATQQYVDAMPTRPRPVVARAPFKQEEVKVSSQTADRLLQLEGTVVIPGHNQAKFVMLPPDYMQQLESKDAEELDEEHQEPELLDEDGPMERSRSPTHAELILDVPKKRPCSCTKSQCLKLYCECFANGEFCSDCNCRDCMNTLANEDERQAAIYNCLERNPNAFRPKIGKVGSTEASLKHNKGCHCKRSGCLKNYCECFEARIPCSDNCKCVGCKNCDDHFDYPKKPGLSAVKRAAATADLEVRTKANEDDEPPPKQPYNFMTAEVVDATVQCMMAQADECQQNGVSTRNTERLILEEFGRCLAEIIDFSNKNTDEQSG